MKTKILTILGVFIFYYSSSQNSNKYWFPEKTHNFSQLEWLEIMSDMANDTFILNCMKGIEKGPMVISHIPYACLVNNEHKIILQFCPECNWVVTDCMDNECFETVSISSDDVYGFHLDNIYAQNIWKPGDTIPELLFLIHTDPHQSLNNVECVLVPLISNIFIPAYPVFPSKRKVKR